MTNSLIRAALYTRVSTQEQARHGLSLSEQQRSLEEYAVSHDMTIVGVYEDAGVSARSDYTKRPALLRLLEDCKAGKVDVILFVKLDRFFRNLSSYYKVNDILNDCGVSWQATTEDYETVTASGRFKVNIMLSVAQDEADRAGERIRFVQAGKRERGEPTSGKLPYGYVIGPDKRFALDPDKIAVVSDIFATFRQNMSISKTLDHIRSTHGVHMTYRILDNILRNTAYYGRYYDHDNICPAIITKAEFDQIQALRYHSPRRTKENRIYLFSGLVTCAVCGRRYTSKYMRDQRYHVLYKYYKCSNRSMQAVRCPNPSVSEKKLEAHLLATVQDTLAALQTQLSSSEKQRARRRDTRSQQDAIRKKIEKLKILYLDDLLSLDEYKRDRAELESALESLQASPDSPAPVDLSSVASVLSGPWLEMYQGADQQTQRLFWRSIIKNIQIFPDHHIEYTFRC